MKCKTKSNEHDAEFSCEFLSNWTFIQNDEQKNET